MKKNWWKTLTFALSIGLLLAGCSVGGDKPTSSGDKVYVIGTDAAYPPFEKMEADKITGFDIDVMQAIADAAGFKFEVRNTGWDPLFDGVEKGTVDAGISSITITDERKQKYDFTEPYFEANQLILVGADSPVGALTDLQGKKIGVQSATTGETVVKKAFGDTYEGIKGYEDTPSAVDDFFNGRVEAVVADNGVLSYFAGKIEGKQYKLIKDNSFAPEHYGIMVQKGNTEFLTKLNQGLKIIKENGKLQEIHDKYFKQ
ncbi:basic amino acid ABC transporter substrate-binding protein [Brevibacillus dissolubilis]|uniref:basic amino acid ABC transporter substrate-binding protein n=1 Tax=Brevibacillus dissolubilis TaxID=1844116 RepID=UPI0011172DA5|nr:basic amino acid ABC transporter substrate-binding protein [Brevibacillus dissolubilis]